MFKAICYLNVISSTKCLLDEIVAAGLLLPNLRSFAPQCSFPHPSSFWFLLCVSYVYQNWRQEWFCFLHPETSRRLILFKDSLLCTPLFSGKKDLKWSLNELFQLALIDVVIVQCICWNLCQFCLCRLLSQSRDHIFLKLVLMRLEIVCLN